MADFLGRGTARFEPAVIEALQRWVDLGRKLKVMAPGVIEWGTTPKDFFERKTAIRETPAHEPDRRKDCPEVGT